MKRRRRADRAQLPRSTPLRFIPRASSSRTPPRRADEVVRRHSRSKLIAPTTEAHRAPSVRKPSPFSPISGSGSPHTPLRSRRPAVQRHRVTARQATCPVWLSLLSSQSPSGESVCESCRVGVSRKPLGRARRRAIKTGEGLRTLISSALSSGGVATTPEQGLRRGLAATEAAPPGKPEPAARTGYAASQRSHPPGHAAPVQTPPT